MLSFCNDRIESIDFLLTILFISFLNTDYLVSVTEQNNVIQSIRFSRFSRQGKIV